MDDSNTVIIDSSEEIMEGKKGRRRSKRISSPTKKYKEYVRSKHKNNDSIPEKLDTIEDSEINNEIQHDEDVQLLHAENEIAGLNIYGFNTPKKRNGMATLALNTPKTPNFVKTPGRHKQSWNSQTNQSKTPSHIRTKLRNQISKVVNDSHSEFEESSSSSTDEIDSDYSCSSDKVSAADDEPKTPYKTRRQVNVPILPKTPSSSRFRQSKLNKKSNDYLPESDDYFQSYSTSKITTSDHTLDRLKNPRLAANRIFGLLAEMKLPIEHETAINDIMEDYRSYFNKWICILNEGFNLLLFGLGSKHQLLQSFHREMLSKQTVLVVNGFFPSLTIKDILDGIIHEILDAEISSSNPHEAVDLIEDELSLIPETHIYLIINNLDGAMLRNARSQDIISRLAKITNIHLLASIDHINTPLLWDQTKLCNFNFSWWDCTTMLSYNNETAYENSLLVQNSGQLALSSMRSVFSSLTTNARGIYMLIVTYQLKNKASPNYQGMPFKELYSNCRELFLVSSDLALRAQLTEFLDHKLLKSKRIVDGSEQVTIPIASGLLQEFLEEQESSRKT